MSWDQAGTEQLDFVTEQLDFVNPGLGALKK